VNRQLGIISGVLLALCLFAAPVLAQTKATDAQKSIGIYFTDGHRQSISLADLDRIEFRSGVIIFFKNGREQSFSTSDIARIEFNSQSSDEPLGRNHFIGKWEVGVGVGSSTFFITLEPNGEARKSIGATHGTWTVVDGEARISWDDGWHDAIRKVGSKHEKFAYEPGKTFSDSPSNVTDARNLTAQPI